MAGLNAFLFGIVPGLAFVLLFHSVRSQPVRQLNALFLAIKVGVTYGASLA